MVTLFFAACEINIIDDTSSKDPGGSENHQLDPADRSYGFGSPVTIGGPAEEGYDYEVTFQYKDGTIVIKPQDYQWIDHVEADSIVYFKAGMPTELRSQVGSSLVLELPEYGCEEILEKVPSGLRNTVLEVSEVDGLLRCVTTIAPLNELYYIFKWEGVFNPLKDMHYIKLADDIEVELEEVDISNFGNGEELESGEDIPWDASEKEQTFCIPRFRHRTREDNSDFRTWPDGSPIRYNHKSIHQRIYLPQDILLKMIQNSLKITADNIDHINIPDEYKRLLTFLSWFDGGFYLYIGCQYYSKGDIQSGLEYNYIQPEIGVEFEGDISPNLSNTDIFINDEKLKKSFKDAFQEFALIPETHITPKAPIQIGKTLFLYIDLQPDLRVMLKLDGSLHLKADIGALSFPIRLDGSSEAPIFIRPKLKDLEIDGTVGLHLLPSMGIGLGIGGKKVEPAFYTYGIIGSNYGLDFDFLHIDVKSDQQGLDWSYDPYLDLNYSFTFQLKTKPNIPRFCSFLLDKDKDFALYTERKTLPLLRKKLYLLPKPKQLQQKTISQDPLTFAFDYTMDPGLLLTLYQLYRPTRLTEALLSLWGKELNVGIHVRDIDMKPFKIVGNFYNENGYSFLSRSFNVHTEITGLNKGTQYRARPVMRLLGLDLNLVYSNLSVPFSSKTPNKLIKRISNYVYLEYDEQGRPIILQDLCEEGTYHFRYNGDNISFRYEEDSVDVFQSTRVETNSQGFITRISGRYNDGETQDILCQYSTDGHLTYVNNVFGEGDSYTSTYRWDEDLLRRIDWKSEEACFANDEDDEDDEEWDNGFITYVYGEKENKLVQYTVTMCEDHNLGCLLMTGLFGLPPAHLPEGIGFPGILTFLPRDYDEIAKMLSKANIKYECDSDGAVRDEFITLLWDGNLADIHFPYFYTTDASYAPRAKMKEPTSRRQRGPFRHKRRSSFSRMR